MGDDRVIIPQGTDINKNCKLEKLRLYPNADITEPPVYCRIGNSPVMTAGNFSLIIGKAKSGKTFFLGSVVASLINNNTQLGTIRGCLPKEKNNILYFDTEQSTFHATRTVKRFCKLARIDSPDNLIAYGLRPLCPRERLSFIEEKIRTTDALGIVVIDGIRDLLSKGINDEEEATRLTSMFLRWTADYNMHLIVLLHQNKNDINARGHIGSEVVNKAETSLAVVRDCKTGIFRVSCDYSRDIAFGDFGFIIQDGLPVGADLPVEGKHKVNEPDMIRDDDHTEKLNVIFKEQRRLSVADFKDAIQYHFNVGENKSRTFLIHYTDVKGWIRRKREGKQVYYEYISAIF